MAKKVALAAAAALALLVALIAIQPGPFSVERSVSIAAPPARIQPHIASVRAMDEWSPWAHMDSEMVIVYEGPDSGVGSRSSWEGPQIGKGRVTVTAVVPERRVEMQLEMLAPMAATNRVIFTLAPRGDRTEVTWRMEGVNGFLGKAVALFVGINRMVGDEFAKGLAALRGLVEGAEGGAVGWHTGPGAG